MDPLEFLDAVAVVVDLIVLAFCASVLVYVVYQVVRARRG